MTKDLCEKLIATCDYLILPVAGVSDNDNGVNEPAVSDAIYSDAACTQSVTTITAIA